ncbi:hypothetical protein J2X19_001628 [Rhodoferax ferrireducens]|uniref:AbiV family abortive infection protein n=1 Tax=Rhodoferax ferrireducens TaxID=192843 RepID=A0ABU2C6J9_9BURK|nr:hypothetical protein [Rhodoferax ferrireducens]MDR7376970.1 hypothetical protein [Rhodoferax ferrireducens]
MRDAYVENLKHGLSDTEAYERILRGYADLLDDREVACLVYFALADTAWKFGRLHKDVKARALELTRQGGDVFVWERDAPGEVPARRKALRSLETRLLSDQPAPKPIKVLKPKPKKIRTTAPVGSVFLLKLPNGYKAMLVLVGFIDLSRSVDPVFSVLNWLGTDLPSQVELDNAARTAMQFQSGLGDMAHIGILPEDERKSVMADLEATGQSTATEMPYNPESFVFKFAEAIGNEISAHFVDRNP